MVGSTAACATEAFHGVAWVAFIEQVCRKEVVTSTYVVGTRIQGFAREVISIPMAWANYSSLGHCLAPTLLCPPSLSWR